MSATRSGIPRQPIGLWWRRYVQAPTVSLYTTNGLCRPVRNLVDTNRCVQELVSVRDMLICGDELRLIKCFYFNRFVTTGFRPARNIPLVVYREQLEPAHVPAPT
ncbi:hypothetical protein AVEN_225569-1 [Araneus ventricosus]|uniref:Uncharacterized protein n=1 Tax=Araneus ventricosus TaxID=182803 RepID=A0A4Y2P883_ARAVE|nr:hypothetical protein AVEN_225569-1 [Araneus ventricosus]